MKINFSKLTISLAVFLFLSGSVLFLQANVANGANVIEFNPQIPIPGLTGRTNVATEVDGKMQSDLLARYIKAIYDYGLAVTGILATIVLMGAGVIWLTSGGNESKITQAKDLIAGSLTGMAILFSAWMILNTVNPELLKLRAITLTKVEAIYGCCAAGQQASFVSKKECETAKGEFFPTVSGKKFTVVGGRCQEVKLYCNVRRDCDGKVQFCFDSDTGTKEIYKENCGSYLNPEVRDLYEIAEGNCSLILGCDGKQINCEKIEDGELCPELSVRGILNDIQLDGYCYDGLCYRGNGAEASRCGTKPGAYCSSLDCSSLGVGSDKYYRDNSGGRKCENNQLFCCYKG